MINPGQLQSFLRPASSLDGAAGQGATDANLGLGIYGGLSQGNLQGDLGAAANAAKLYGNISGSPEASQFGGDLGAGLGVYGGIQRGGVAGDTQAALAATQLASQAASQAGVTGAAQLASAVSQYAPIIGMALSAYMDAQTPAYVLKPSYYQNMAKSLVNGPGPAANHSYNATPQDQQREANYWGAVGEASISGDPAETGMLKALGIQPMTPALHDISYEQLNTALGQHGMSNVRPHGHMAKGGTVTHSLADILNGPMFSERAATPHFDGGGYVNYYTSPGWLNEGSSISQNTPDMQQFVLPNDSQQSLQQALQNNMPSTGYDLNGNSFNVNENVKPYGDNLLQAGSPALQSLQTPSHIPGINGSGLSGALSSLLSNPSLLGALLGGGVGLAGALGSNNGQQQMLANYKPTPPPMFQGSGPSASNMYGNFTSDPRTRLSPTIDYAHAGEQAHTPYQFFSNNSGGPTAPASQSSPMQQYGAQSPTQTPSMTSPSLSQLIALLGNNSSGPTVHPMLQAHGGAIHQQGPLAASMNPHLTPASKGGPNYIQGPGDGTSDDIDAKLSNGEYVMTAQDVALLGNGSNEAGAKKLDELRRRLRMDAGKKLVKGEQFMKAKKDPLAYANGGKP
jgi:hypothetical protein